MFNKLRVKLAPSAPCNVNKATMLALVISWKTCEHHNPPPPYTLSNLQLKLCQQEMLFPVTESSFAHFTPIPVKATNSALTSGYTYPTDLGQEEKDLSGTAILVIFYSTSHLCEFG